MSSTRETEVFQHYQVLKRPDGALWELGRGAMGITYKAFDTNLRCDVALKVINALHLNSETARARFLREARAAAGLRHRNVASVYHLGNDDQSFFYAMEFVDGETVECLVKETGPMPPVDALQIVVQIARALGAAAKQNLVHRDIKPANIMVTREDDEEEQFVVKVIDFGLARPALGGEGSAHITMGGFVGTPQFASPEQLEEKDLDARSDIYSLGVTLWFMIAGRPPFTGPLGSVFIQQLTKEPPWAQLEGTPEPVRALLAGMLEKEPDKRPQTPVELRRQVEACLRQLPAADRLFAPTPFAAEPTVTGSVTGTEAPLPRSASPAAAGGLLGGRYELAELAGEGTNGRVFRALDREGAGAPVAVKILHGDVLASSAERRRLEGELDKLRGAAHPHLLEFQGLREAADTSFLVGEWVNGFTLVDLLRRRGQLPLPETLRLLAQAATVADHAREHDLRRLELSLHQIMTAFETPADSRAALTAPLEQWPPFGLKFDALGITREAGDSVTWGGDRTMMPALLGRDTQTSIRGLVEGSDLFALGGMTYELLNGAPPAHGRHPGAREARYVALPALNEAANLVLRRALSPNPGFGSNVDFFKALVDASGLPEIYLEAAAGGAGRETFAVERLPVSGTGAEEAGATLILGDGESLPAEPVTARGPSAEERARAEEERFEAERAAAERAAAERAEARRIAAEQARAEREEAERVAAEQAEAERLEAERLQAEREEARRIEVERIAAERVEAERLEAERREAERIEGERLEAERAEASRVETERRQSEKAEADRLAAERAEAQRLEAERIAARRAEAKRLEDIRLKAEKAEADRLAAERAEARRIEAERAAAEKAEARRLEAEQLAAEKVETERLKAERAEAKRIEAERLKAEKLAADRLKAEKAEAARLEAARVKAERAEARRLEAEQLKADKAEADRQRAAAQFRDVASAAGAGAGDREAGEAGPARKPAKVLLGAVAGLFVLAAVGVAVFLPGRQQQPATSQPSAAVEAPVNPVVETSPVQPQEPAAAAANLVVTAPPPPPASTPVAIEEPDLSAAGVEPSPGPVATPEPSAPPAWVAATPPPPPAITPAPANKQDEPENRRDRRGSENDRTARPADGAATNRLTNRTRDEPASPREREKRDPTPEPRKKPPAVVTAAKPEKPKATPAPANRPSGPFILR